MHKKHSEWERERGREGERVSSNREERKSRVVKQVTEDERERGREKRRNVRLY